MHGHLRVQVLPIKGLAKQVLDEYLWNWLTISMLNVYNTLEVRSVKSTGTRLKYYYPFVFKGIILKLRIIHVAL